MNQEKIGKFIAELRKEKNLTQQELADKLGVTDRAIGNWENGRRLPDYTILKSLCDELGITINDLMSGEKISKEEYQEKFEENIVNTIDYSSKKLNKYREAISLILITFGLFVSMTALMIFPSESSWGSIYSTFGIVIFTVGTSIMMNTTKLSKRILLSLVVFILAMMGLLTADYINVRYNKEAPMFRTTATTTGSVIYYDTPFYDVYRCNFDTENEYWTVEKNSNPTINELIDYCK